MKYIIPIVTVLFTLLLVQSVSAGDDAKKAKKEAKKEARRFADVGKVMHVVTLKFKAGTTEPQIEAVVNAFRDLPAKIPQISSLEWGSNVSPEKHDKGFTHCFVLAFKTDKDRDDYLVHPDHKEFGKVLGPVLGDVMVIDFVAKK